MPLLYYRDALKRAQKEFRACTSNGEYPCLPVSEDFVPQKDLLHTTDLDAGSIYAHVIRVLPQRNGSREVEQYCEFLDFCQLSRINFPEISKPGGYARLQNLVGKQPGGSFDPMRNAAAFPTLFTVFGRSVRPTAEISSVCRQQTLEHGIRPLPGR